MEKQEEKLMTRRIWFRAKKYGWGWYPVTWQGWIVILIGLFLIIREAVQFDENSQSGSDVLIGLLLPVFCVVTLMLITTYATGEKPGWHWGDCPKDCKTDEINRV
jgi:hypothetical protein